MHPQFRTFKDVEINPKTMPLESRAFKGVQNKRERERERETVSLQLEGFFEVYFTERRYHLLWGHSRVQKMRISPELRAIMGI